jgi:hypothetical protein
MSQPTLRLLGRHVSVAHSTMVHRTLQTVNGHLDMTVVHDLKSRLGVSQGLLRMLDEHLGVSHVSMPDSLLAVLHGLRYMTRDGKVRDRLVGLAGRDLRMTHITVLDRLFQACNRLGGMGIRHVSQGRFRVGQSLGRMLHEDGCMTHPAMVGGLLGMDRSLCEVIILRVSGLSFRSFGFCNIRLPSARHENECGSGKEGKGRFSVAHSRTPGE